MGAILQYSSGMRNIYRHSFNGVYMKEDTNNFDHDQLFKKQIMHKHDNAIVLICKWKMLWSNSVIRFLWIWVSRIPVHALPVKWKQDILFTMMLLQTAIHSISIP